MTKTATVAKQIQAAQKEMARISLRRHKTTREIDRYAELAALVASLSAAPAAVAVDLDAILAMIAKNHLGLETLETRHSDGLDFSDQAVWSIKAALEVAFETGRASVRS